MSDTPNPSNPLEDVSSDDLIDELGDLLAQALFGADTYEEITADNQTSIRVRLAGFKSIAGDISGIIQNIENDTLTYSQISSLDLLVGERQDPIRQAFITEYRDLLDGSGYSDREADLEGYMLYELLDKYSTYKAQKAAVKEAGLDFESLIEQQLSQMGDFKAADFFDAIQEIDTSRRLGEKIGIRGSKFREDKAPANIAEWQCRIGASTFYVPPTSIDVYQDFKTTSLAGAALRQPNSPKINMGHSETMISMTIYFPTHETIWGFDGDEADWQFHQWDPQNNFTEQEGEDVLGEGVIDNYLSSLRGLVTQFKYAPFLPVRNAYLNRAHDIDAVALMNMTVSTVENFPYVAAVTLEMAKFNYTPFMPMINHFDQAIHWGKFRQYMGRAALTLDKKTNKGFLVETTWKNNGAQGVEVRETAYENEYSGTISKVRDIDDGKNFDLYYPITTPSQIFAGDTTDFRQPGEEDVFTQEYWSFLLGDLGLQPVDAPDFNFFEYDKRRRVYTSERDILRRWLNANELIWENMTSDEFENFVQKAIADGQQNGTVTPSNQAAFEANLRAEWFYVLFDDILSNDPVFEQIKRRRESQETGYIIKEWEVPMDKAGIDWDACIVTGIGVSLSNRFAKLQLQLQDEPTHQHIGGGDSTIEVEMKVLGQNNLIAFRRLFQHINGLGRLERQHGVLGFLGIKNMFTALCGVKYALPMSFEVETVPNYPDVYNVRMSFVDFDVMQQRREDISSETQKDLIDQFGKRNPFFRIKQSWGSVKCYPDFPLEVYDEDGGTIGHLDPDWYFRSFQRDNADLVNWGVSQRAVALLQEYSSLQDLIEQYGGVELAQRLSEIKQELIEVAQEENGIFPPGWEINEGEISTIPDNQVYSEEKREYRYFLGAYGPDQEKLAILDMFPGGYFRIGELTKATKEVEYVTDYSALSEDLASVNTKGQVHVEGTTALSEYQNEYFRGYSNPNRQYESVMQDWDYRNNDGRMIKAFPTYMLWLIDEGGRFAGIKLFDNLYGMNSIMDFSVMNSAENPVSDTLVLRLSNVYDKLTRSYKESIISEDDPLSDSPIGAAIQTVENRKKNFESGLYDSLVELNNVRLKPGVRIHLRAGYSSNPNALDTIFNGTIMEVETGQVMTVIAQSDAVEFSGYVNTTGQNDHSGKLDGGLHNFWLSEPRDLIVRLLSMGSSNFKEWLSWGSKGVIFSESRFGIRHFGTILYEPMTSSEVVGTFNKQVEGVNAMTAGTTSEGQGFSALLGDALGSVSEISSMGTLWGATGDTASVLANLTTRLFANSLADRDFEVYKRNIYPGNGTGVAQFMGGDLLDAGILLTQTGTVYDPDGDRSDTENTTVGDPLDPNSQGTDDPASNTNSTPEDQVRDNTNTINQFWRDYYSETGASRNDLLEMLSDPNNAAIEFEDTSDRGLIEKILFPQPKDAWAAATTVTDALFNIVSLLPDEIEIPLRVTSYLTVPGAALVENINIRNTWSGLGRLVNSPFGQALGLGQVVRDDDLRGFDEVSFRAQTYMKTVWDLFQVCAALLPNYIVAVRPFEDRSTLFYGKPHWLYTSGLIPVTTGVQSAIQARPRFDQRDSGISDIVSQAGNFDSEVQRMLDVASETSDLKSPESFLLNNMDPYDVTSVLDGTSILSQEEIAALFGPVVADRESTEIPFDPIEAFKSIDYSALTSEEIAVLVNITEAVLNDSLSDSIAEETYQFLSEDDQAVDRDALIDAINAFNDAYNDGNVNSQSRFDEFIATYVSARNRTISTGVINLDNFGDIDEIIDQVKKDETLTDELEANVLNLLETDPITFAYRFGWRYSRIPVWVGPDVNAGYDIYGSIARNRYDEDASITTDVIGAGGGNEGRGVDEAQDIWLDFRNTFRYIKTAQEAFVLRYPEPDEQALFDETVDLFLRFMWQDPYNRAWVVLRAERYQENPIQMGPADELADLGVEILTGGRASVPQADEFIGTDFATGDSITIQVGEDRWNFYGGIGGAWEAFLEGGTSEVAADEQVQSPSARSYMRNNEGQGSDATNIFTGAIESGIDWFDSNIGQVIGLVMDSVSGLIASIRMSLAQISQSLNQAGEFQKQANALNNLLNDSVYYQLGGEGEDLLRAVDNPFTREYGEPVVEVREPFQRVHMVSSFDSILNNGIIENLDGVATTVTAVSDGKNPVTTHFDKGIPPDRQIEKTVETGIYFDNVFGSGFFGMFQPLINPLEHIRGVAKAFSNTSDELSARRIGLYHLKNSLKNIYKGEIILIGNTSIRPYDLLYISDNYNRMFGMVEVGQVTHHFTPETGLITAVTPNAMVTVNDPARWTMTSYLWNKLTSYAMRDEMRALVNINSERFISSVGAKYQDFASGDLLIPEEDLFNQFSDHIAGAAQWTQGNTAIVRDLGAVFAGGGIQGITRRDQVLNKVAQLDIGIGLVKGGLTGAGALIGTAANPGYGTLVGGAAGYVIGDLIWEAWQWIKNNLLDQQGCYIQYLNKDGQAMDAGLSYFQGNSVGSNHTLSLFPNVFGIKSPKTTVTVDGNYRITTNDLLASLGWTEVETTALHKDVSLFLNQQNAAVLDLAGRGPNAPIIDNDDYEYTICRVLESSGEPITDADGEPVVDDNGDPILRSGVIDGDTIWVRVLSTPLNTSTPFTAGQHVNVRLSAVNTPELLYKNNPYTDFNEVALNDPNDLGRLAQEFIEARLEAPGNSRIVAMRVKKTERVDKFGRTLGTIFHNIPIGTDELDRQKVLLAYASANPPIPWYAYLDDGRAHTLNWELVMAGYGNVDMRDSLWDSHWRDEAVEGT